MTSTMSDTWKGDRESMGRAMEACRGYLLLVAGRRLAPDLKHKEESSDVVQDMLAEALRLFGRFQGSTEADLLAWLRRILLHKLAHTGRRYGTVQKRRIGREVAFDPKAAPPSRNESSPGDLAICREKAAALAAALDRLPETMRLAVIWRHDEACSFDEIGRRLGRSNVAARNLWLRALEELRRKLVAAGQVD